MEAPKGEKRKEQRTCLKKQWLKIKSEERNLNQKCSNNIRKDELKVHTKTHCNQTAKSQRQRQNLESSKGKANHHVQRNTHKIINNFSSEILHARKEWAHKVKALEEKTANQDTTSGKTVVQK